MYLVINHLMRWANKRIQIMCTTALIDIKTGLQKLLEYMLLKL